MSAYAVYETESIGKDGALEANGEIRWACCAQHAQWLATKFTDYRIGTSDAAWPGTVCEICGASVC